MHSPNTKALAALISTVIIWGITPVFVRKVSLILGPFDSLVIRMVLGALLFAVLLAFTTGFRLQRSDWLRLMFVTYCGFFVYYTFSIIGFALAPAGIGTLIMASQPILIGLLAWLIGAERITAMTIAGLFVSFVGSALLVGGDDLGIVATEKGNLLLGCLAILVASIGWTIYVVFSRDLTQRHGAIKIAGLSHLLIALPLLPFIRKDMPGKLFAMPGEAQLGFLFLATIGTLSIIGWNYAAPRLRPSLLGMSLYVMPLVAILAGWLILNENITLQILIAAALILAGVAIAQIKTRPLGSAKVTT